MMDMLCTTTNLSVTVTFSLNERECSEKLLVRPTIMDVTNIHVNYPSVN